MCYPVHCTHVLQGLDVVAFLALKHWYTKIRDAWNEKNAPAKLDKGEFLTVYAEAHKKALTLENVRASFEKTGVWPFNPSVICSEQICPSVEHSTAGSLPLPITSPVKHIIHFHQKLMSGHFERKVSPLLDKSQDIHMYHTEDGPCFNTNDGIEMNQNVDSSRNVETS
jgi:hypothetical protein